MRGGAHPLRPQGAEVVAGGVRYRVWAPEKKRVEVLVRPREGDTRALVLTPEPDGFHVAVDAHGRSGDLYRYVLDGEGPFPDPASRSQPEGVHGASQVIDLSTFAWSDAGWNCPPLRDLVLYELHIGTFTAEGTFRAAIGRLPHLRELGVTALQIMPVADFPGDRNWGYDGVSIYAPARCYGSPDDLRALVDAAHAHGLAVVLDVVYNHLGPDGNYLGVFSRWCYNESRDTPWGKAFNFDGEHRAAVRAFFAGNAVFWIDEYHFDGLRLDATHAIPDDSPRHLLAEIAAAVHERGAFVIAEDERNLASLIEPEGCALDAVYADDFCHSIQVALGDDGYADDFNGSADEIADELRHGWHYRGQLSRHHEVPRGTPCAHLPPESFVLCISNHDQTGNRAFGDRLHQLAAPEAYRAACALLLLAPGTPMLFMGQEWGASTPFLYFTDHHPELGRLVTEGRRKEFTRFPEFRDPAIAATIPDPQSRGTFERSKLNWSEITHAPHAGLLALHRECLALRASDPAFRPASRAGWEVGEGAVVTLQVRSAAGRWLVLAHLAANSSFAILPDAHWQCVLSTNDTRFGGSGRSAWQPETGRVTFDHPELLVLHSIT